MVDSHAVQLVLLRWVPGGQHILRRMQSQQCPAAAGGLASVLFEQQLGQLNSTAHSSALMQLAGAVIVNCMGSGWTALCGTNRLPAVAMYGALQQELQVQHEPGPLLHCGLQPGIHGILEARTSEHEHKQAQAQAVVRVHPVLP